MSETITIAPVRKTIRVGVPQARAFEVFTAGIGRWWPSRASIGASAFRSVTIEPAFGGRWYEIGTDGAETDVGRVTVWDPPRRLVAAWHINAQWKPDTSVASEVEVRFVADGPNATIVELEHRNFESLGAEGGASIREQVNGGWPGILDEFKNETEK
jgi:hypothetical protein